MLAATLRPRPIDLRTLGVALLALAGCNPVFAPPVRSTHGLTPRELRGGEVIAMGAANLYASGGPTIDVGVGSGFQVEAGGDFRAVENESWAMGYAGARLGHEARADREDSGASFDVGLGAGLGAGGTDDSEVGDGSAAAPWDERLAYGSYLDVGVGYLSGSFPWLAPFVRVRAQASAAEGLPATFWGSGMVGLELVLGPLSIPLATGYAGYVNERDGQSGWVPLETGLALRWEDEPEDR